MAGGGKAERLASTPAEPSYRHLAVGRWKLLNVIGGGIEIGSDGIGIEFENSLHNGVTVGKIAALAAIRPEAREQVRGDGNVSGGGQFVRGAAHPVAQAEDFMDQNHGRRFSLGLGINDECVNHAV